ncbi:MAG: S8 family serine peptidase [Pseudobdellovibrio sp.]
MMLKGRAAQFLAMAALTTTSLVVKANTNQVESVPGEYVVRLKPNTNMMEMSTQALSTSLGSYIKSTIPSQNIVVVKRASFESSISAVKALAMNPNVDIAEPNYIYHASRTPDDPMLGNLWGMSNTGQKDSSGKVGVAGVDIGAVQAWDIATGSDKMLVAIIDTGIDFTHPDLVDNLWTNEAEANGKEGIDDDNNGVIDDIHGFNAITGTGDAHDDQGHGSHCAGTIGAKGNDGKGIVGVNWDVKMMAVKFLDANGSGTLENAVKAIDYATKMGAKVMSNSWGGGGFSQALFDVIKKTNDAGAIFIAAAGNDNNNNDTNPSYPATYDVPNIISVAAIDNQGNRASFSSFGKRTVHVGAPGVNIYSSTGGAYDSWSGTSMATPHVSGIAALVWSHEPGLSNVELKNRIIATARPIAGLKGKVSSGGLANAYNALTNTTPAPDANDPANWRSVALEAPVASASPYLKNTNQTFEVNVKDVPADAEIALYFEKFDTEANYDTVQIYDSTGALIQTLSGTNDDSYSAPIKGGYAKIVFKSDASVQRNGWSITKVAFR